MAHELRRDDIPAWLRCRDPQRLEQLWALADQQRARSVGECVHLRGLVEISNHCVRSCAYCGISAGNSLLNRYRMSHAEIMACANQAVAYGYGTLVLQAGEDPGLDADRVAELVRAIKRETPLAVTLSLGERALDECALWREAGADRYLLRFETSDPELFARIHPPRTASVSCDRIELLRAIKSLGYETGSGIMVGIPGQSYESLVRDLEFFLKLDLDMIGIGPWIEHPARPMPAGSFPDAGGDQVPATEEMTCIVLALARLICPDANIPSTTALATINSAQGRAHGLERGANVCMPNLTPVQYRHLYDIYPDKAGSRHAPEESHRSVCALLAALGRPAARGPGGRRDRMNDLNRPARS